MTKKVIRKTVISGILIMTMIGLIVTAIIGAVLKNFHLCEFAFSCGCIVTALTYMWLKRNATTGD